MDSSCTECGYDYRWLTTGDASTTLRNEAAALADVVRSRLPVASVPAGSWSALEYAGHVRDVLIVTRERMLHARRVNGAVVETMGPNERVDWGEYRNLSEAHVAGEIRQAAEWLARSWDLFADDDWDRTLIYNYPEPRTRHLLWVAAHVVHELVHHRMDIERLTIGPGMSGSAPKLSPRE